MRERQKAKYRLIVFGLMAVLGPPAFGMGSVFAILYSILLALYSLWALRLTVVFTDDTSLGYLLCVFDAVIVVPMVLWGSTRRLLVPLVLIWLGGVFMSIRAARRLRTEPKATAGDGTAVIDSRDEASGFGTRAGFVRALGELYTGDGDSKSTGFSVVVVRLRRYEELALLSGPQAAGRALGALARRVRRQAGDALNGHQIDGYRIMDDRIALVLKGVIPGLPAIVAEARRSASARLVDGRKLEVLIGYADFPQDGVTPRELLVAAEASMEAHPAVAGGALAAGSQLVMGS
ncbi:MAG: hypothetical protein GX604_05830 [Actinobacteria bacterium]|nr:hypothetical protein [Actinomycetota bacterium]